MVKPRIKPDPFFPGSFICKSLEPSYWRPGGKWPVTGTGDTMVDAYNGWKIAVGKWVAHGERLKP